MLQVITSIILLMNNDAKKVFEGEIFTVYQWQQKMFDGSYATFEKISRPDTVNVIARTIEGKFLVIKDEQPHRGIKLTLPGGRLDEGESAIIAVQRELLEETGYLAGKVELLYKTHASRKIDWSLHMYLADSVVKQGHQNLDIGGERIEVLEYTKENFLDFLLQQRSFPELKIKALELRLDPNTKNGLEGYIL